MRGVEQFVSAALLRSEKRRSKVYMRSMVDLARRLDESKTETRVLSRSLERVRKELDQTTARDFQRISELEHKLATLKKYLTEVGVTIRETEG